MYVHAIIEKIMFVIFIAQFIIIKVYTYHIMLMGMHNDYSIYDSDVLAPITYEYFYTYLVQIYLKTLFFGIFQTYITF